MLQNLSIDNPLKAALTSGLTDGSMTGKVVTENIDKLPHALQSLAKYAAPIVSGKSLGSDFFAFRLLTKLPSIAKNMASKYLSH